MSVCTSHHELRAAGLASQLELERSQPARVVLELLEGWDGSASAAAAEVPAVDAAVQKYDKPVLAQSHEV